jgi:uncharacterized protein YhjY with autotransporter beta-barrel domain
MEIPLAGPSRDGYEVSTFGDSGYNINCGSLTFGPIVSMQYTTAPISGFTEHGSLVPLDIHADSEDSLRTDLGGQASYTWHLGSISVIPGLRLAWEHEFKYSNLHITASVPTLGKATLTGPNLGHDSLLINANIAIPISPRIWATTAKLPGIITVPTRSPGLSVSVFNPNSDFRLSTCIRLNHHMDGRYHEFDSQLA